MVITLIVLLGVALGFVVYKLDRAHTTKISISSTLAPQPPESKPTHTDVSPGTEKP